jgi:hypothetical protein
VVVEEPVVQTVVYVEVVKVVVVVDAVVGEVG